MNSQKEERLAAYLLGELPEDKENEIEEEFLFADDARDQLSVVEDELICAYLLDELPAARRARFEKHFLAAAPRRQRLRFARVMLEYAARQDAADALPKSVPAAPGLWQQLLAFFRQPAGHLAFAALALMLLLAGGLTFEVIRLRSQVAQLQAGQRTPTPGLEQQLNAERQRAEELAAQLKREQEARAQLERELSQQPANNGAETGPSLLALALTPLSMRAEGGAPQLTITPGAERVKLQLALIGADEYAAFQAVIRSAEGAEIWRGDSIKPVTGRAGRAINLLVPARSLATGAYFIKVSGVSGDSAEEVADYSFTVVKK